MIVVACVVLALQTPPRDHFNGGGPVVILDEATADTADASEADPADGEGSPMSVAQLRREISELEKQEMGHAAARQKALESAMEATSSLNCTEAEVGCKHAAKAIRWKASKDQYEQAALRDITKEWKKERNVTAEGLADFHKIQLKASQLSGIKELDSLQKTAAAAELARNKAQEQTLSVLRAETKQLDALKLKEKEAREAREEQKQAQADAKLQSEKAQNLHAMAYQPAERARSAQEALHSVEAQDASFEKQKQRSSRAREEGQLMTAAKSEDSQREQAFHNELAAMKAADAKARAQHQALLNSLAKESQAATASKEGGKSEGGPKKEGLSAEEEEEEGGHRADLAQAEREEQKRQGAVEGERARLLEEHEASAAQRQQTATKEADQALHQADAAMG